MPDENPNSRAGPLPKVIRSEDDYGRVMDRIMEITHAVGPEPEPGEFSFLFAQAELWEDRRRR